MNLGAPPDDDATGDSSERARSLAARINALDLDDNASDDADSTRLDTPAVRLHGDVVVHDEKSQTVSLEDLDIVESDPAAAASSGPLPVFKPIATNVAKAPPPPPRVAIPPRPPSSAVRVPPVSPPRPPGTIPAVPITKPGFAAPPKPGTQPIAKVPVPPPPSGKLPTQSIPIPRMSTGPMPSVGPGMIPAPPSRPPRALSEIELIEDDLAPGVEPGRGKRPTGAPPIFEGVQSVRPSTPIAGGDELIAALDAPPDSLAPTDGGLETGTGTPNIVIDQPLEAHLDSPTVVDRALEELGDAGGEKRAATLAKDLDATTDATAAAMLAYELGELYERRLADEARAVKAYGRALTLDPGLRPNLWAIRRVFYRRGLWPNLAKLIGAEVDYARDDYERADLLLEKARISVHNMGEAGEAKEALVEATRIAPTHQGALLELERVAARENDTTLLLEVWEALADAVTHPARKVTYWLEVAIEAGKASSTSRDYARAQSAFEQAATIAKAFTESATPPPAGASSLAERVARERLRVAEENQANDDVTKAIDELAAILLAQFGPAGPSADPGLASTTLDRPTALRRELVALRRRQAQLARVDSPEKAWDVLQQALALAPGEPLLLADLTELAEELGRYADLAELVQSWQAVEGDPGRAMMLSIRRADALLRGGQREQARALLTSLEASAPGFIVLSSAAERDAVGNADPLELAKTYLAAANAAQLGTWLGPGQAPQPDLPSAAALYTQAAELLAYETEGGFDQAREALGKALEVVANYPAAIEALTELDEATGNVADALARIKTSAEAAGAAGRLDEKRAQLERGIRVARSQGELESVLELEREVAALAPGDLSLRWRMESTLAQLGRDEERAQLLAELATAEPDPTRRGTALLASARLRERSGAVEAATEQYRQVLALWPEDTFARESLIDLLRAQERWTELVAERRAEARALPDGPSARRALREAAWILEVRLEDVASAAAVYEEWLTRIPEDRTALEGAARARGQFGDRNGEVIARRAIADNDPSAESQWLLARALERAGQFDEAADVFRALAVRDPEGAPVDERSVASASAALGLADLAAGRADTVMRLEATSALATRTSDVRLAAALAEDSGWMYALVLEDFERAQQAFEAAIGVEPHRRGALLGAALVAARRSDPAALQLAYDALADSVEMPEAAAALHMRAAAIAAASGDLELANRRVLAARTSAPDDVSALVVLAEASATPHVDADAIAGDPNAVIDPLLARAEVLELRSALADDPAAQAAWELDHAEALELAGRLREAGAVVNSVLKAQPDDLRALEALRRLAKRAGDDAAWGRASYLLARAIGDSQARLQYLRDAVSVIDRPETTDDNSAAIVLAAYKRILKVDPGAPELERLLAIQRERADVRGLVDTLTDRLTYLEAESGQGAAMVPLLLERATVLHGLGDHPGAMADLDALIERQPTHAEALRFRADLALHAGDVDQAVSLWRRCIAAETRPQRRGEVELQLSQVLAENVNDVAGAIENLERVVDANPDDLALRERLLGLCLRAADWTRAARELRVLAKMRPTPAEKAREELRLGLMLRDKLSDRVGARMALDRGRTLDPLNLDIVRELSELLEGPARVQMLAGTANNFRDSIVHSPGNASLYERLAQITGWQSDVDARWLSLACVEALGTPSADQRQVLAQGRQKLGSPTKTKLDDAHRTALRHGSLGPLADLWRAIAPAVQVATGVDPGKLGFVRGDRIALKKLGKEYEALSTALACFGVEDVEIYISGARAGIARAVAGETPILCVGADVATGAMPQQRFALGRALAMLAEGLGGLAGLREGELGWTIVAALRACDVTPIPRVIADAATGEESSIAERAKLLKKELGRKQKAAVNELVRTKATELAAIDEFRRDALAIGHRAGLLWCGDIAVAHAQLDVGKGGKALSDSPFALELTAWSISDDHMKLREKLGVALKGSR
ncbi:MAG TPA: tetratricopeptide repeat protein [Kofleriaceae bacterium]